MLAAPSCQEYTMRTEPLTAIDDACRGPGAQMPRAARIAPQWRA
jgi:hypothetical protein